MAVAGLLLVDKPAGITSHDVVARVRKLAGTRKVGHAGTLDPMATGLLVLGIEAGTKLLTFVVGNDKTYLATIRLGQNTTTDDAEGEVIDTRDADQISLEQIHAEIAKLTGDILQRPSSVSAIKVDGERAYARVRAGEIVELPQRPVTVESFEIVSPMRSTGRFIDIDVEVSCSSGTYIRALARDLGEALGVGGHLTALRRTRIGGFKVADAITLENAPAALPIVPNAEAARLILPVINIDEVQALELRQGKRPQIEIEALSAAIDGAGKLVAIVEPVGKQIKSLVVFNETSEV
jgi:tRNA pseudouridine55 synthase